MGVEEIRRALESKKEEIRNLYKENKLDEAEAALEEKRNLEKQLKIAEEVEAEERADLKSQGGKKEMEKREVTKEMQLRAAVKFSMGKKMSEEERSLVTVSGNTAVLPEGFISQIEVYRKGFPSLKPYCHVIPVTTKTGKMPVASLGQNKLAKLTSGEAIPEGAMVTQSVPYDIEDAGKFVPIERDLTDDEAVGLVQNVLLPDFAEGAVNCENDDIITILKTNATAVTGGTSYTAVENAIDSTLPGAKAGLITVTNTTGYCYLKNLKDTTGRALNLVTNVNGVDYFHGYPLVYLDDADVVPGTAGNQIFYTANLKELVKFFDRKQVLVEKSTEFLFNKNQDCLRAIERYDTVKGNARSAKKIEFKVGA